MKSFYCFNYFSSNISFLDEGIYLSLDLRAHRGCYTYKVSVVISFGLLQESVVTFSKRLGI